MSELYLIVSLAGETVALPADEIESVVELGAITPVPLAPPHLAGLSALRSRVITVIDAARALGLAGVTPREGGEAVIVTLDGHPYGLVVDAIEDVTAASAAAPLRAALSPRWQRVASGMIEIDDAAMLVVRPAALILGPAAIAA